MEQVSPQRPFAPAWAGHGPELVVYAGIVVLGGLLWWLSGSYPSAMPFWMPWEFSGPEYLAIALVAFWFCRGLLLTPAAARPSVWRQLAFWLGLAAVYAVLQTHFEYWAQHMFFLNRIQHVVMHHLGPFLIALGGAGATIKQGMPAVLQRLIDSSWVRRTMHVLQQPLLAAVIFVGSFALWLIPDVHFRAMLDGRLYALMNWTMVLDGVLFWSLVLDFRPKPPARTSYGVRAALSVGVMFPQIILGAIIGFSAHDLYPYYDLCGRIIPSIGAINDQHIGGVIIWIPPAMMSVIGMLVVLNAMRINDDSKHEDDSDAAALAALSSRWTGR